MNKNSTKIILAVVLLLAAIGVFAWNSGMLSSSGSSGGVPPEEESVEGTGTEGDSAAGGKEKDFRTQ